MRTRVLMVAFLTLPAPRAALSQVSIELGPVFYLAQRLVAQPRVEAPEGSQASALTESGTWLGAEGRIRYGSFSLSGGVVQGDLRNRQLNSQVDTDLRVSRASLLFHPTTWLAFGGDADVWRSIRADLGYAAERLVRRIGAGIEISGTLGVPGLRSVLNGAFYPGGSAKQGFADLTMPDKIDPAELNYRASVMMEYTSPRLPLYVRVGYRAERFATQLVVDDNNINDQIFGLTVSAGMAIGR